MSKISKLTIFFITSTILLLLVLGLIIYTLFRFNILPLFSNTNDSIISTVSLSELGLDQIETQIIATDLDVPWALSFVDDKTILVSERTGRVRIIRDEQLLSNVALDISDDVVAIGEAGLMSITLDPDFKSNNYVYIYHTYKLNGEVFLKVERYEFINDLLINPFTVIGDIPSGSTHSGGEIAFGPDNKLYITTGDIAKADLAQDLSSLAGKTLRLNSNGTIPTNNPFYDQKNARKEIWSYGHRNAQGLDWHPETNEMYQSEHGPSGFDGGVGQDEINLIRRGQNYGWPIIRGEEKASNMFSPLINYTPAVAPGSLIFVNDDSSRLNNLMLLATLRGSSILVLRTSGEQIEQVGSIVNNEFGRIREVQIGPDGNIYFTTSNTDGRGSVQQGDDKVIKIILN